MSSPLDSHMSWPETRSISVKMMMTSLLVSSLVSVACGDPKTTHPSPREAFEQLEASSAPETVVATVDGDPIGLATLQRYWDRHPQLTRRDVLDRVINRRIASERARSMPDVWRELEYPRKRALVRRLLRQTIEAKITRETLDDDTVDQTMDELRRRARQPPGLEASHLLVMLPKSMRQPDDSSSRRDQLLSQAREWSRRIRETLPERPSIERLYRALQRFESKVPSPLEIVVNARLTFPRPGSADETPNLPEGWRRVVPGFGEAAEQLAKRDQLGVLSTPAQSRYGWHLVVVHKRISERLPEPEALRQLTVDRLLRRRRTKALQSRMRSWTRGASVSLYPDIITRDDQTSSPRSP